MVVSLVRCLVDILMKQNLKEKNNGRINGETEGNGDENEATRARPTNPAHPEANGERGIKGV